ncbi:MAG TPA: hypothetical protein DGU45_03845 [Planctomycetes bacterium]|nr:hypothetical protein [Planctomycetota bacterium]
MGHQPKGFEMNNIANGQNVTTNVNSVIFPTARVVSGLLGFYALCTIATNYSIATNFDVNVFAGMVATALVTCFAVCTASMWKNGFQVFSGNVDNISEAGTFWSNLATGFVISCVVFTAGAFFASAGSTNIVNALAPAFFPFFIGLCAYYSCKTVSSACATTAVAWVNASAIRNNVSGIATSVVNDMNVTNDSKAASYTS